MVTFTFCALSCTIIWMYRNSVCSKCSITVILYHDELQTLKRSATDGAKLSWPCTNPAAFLWCPPPAVCLSRRIHPDQQSVRAGVVECKAPAKVYGIRKEATVAHETDNGSQTQQQGEEMGDQGADKPDEKKSLFRWFLSADEAAMMTFAIG